MIVKILKILNRLFPVIFTKLLNFLYPKEQININLDLTSLNQKKVLISYVSLVGVDFTNPMHAACFQLNQMLHYFIQKGCCVDVCDCNDLDAYERLKHGHYDIMIGFGKVFKAFAANSNIPMRILYITENNPEIVNKKYSERLNYLISRHSRLNLTRNRSLVRNDYYDMEQYKMADYAILMSSSFNALTINPYFKKIWTINCNAIINKKYVFDPINLIPLIEDSKRNFLWFGSSGLIHKGVDLLLDVFRVLPEYTLNCYGLNPREKNLFNKLKAPNTFDLGYINVLDVSFINNVVLRHCFIIFPSCSEGMSTAVATCMSHGLIPILTKESGFEPTPFMIELEDYKIENIEKAVKYAVSLTDEEILEYRNLNFQYARKVFDLCYFNKSFVNIMNDLLSGIL